jgi:hypothetical protein
MGSTPSMSQHRRPRPPGQPGVAALALLIALAATCAACGGLGPGTIAPAGTCNDFVTTVRTSASSYAPGQPVIVSVTEANEGPTCYGIPPEWCGSLQAFASADNPAGQDVWDNDASRTIPGQETCPFAAAPGPRWPARYSDTQRLEWHQDRCASDFASDRPGHANPNCPGTPVPAGRYLIVGNGTSAPVTITITGERRGYRAAEEGHDAS